MCLFRQVMENCVLVELFGGLGNQLFQYTAGRVLSEKWGAPLFLTKETENKHNQTQLDYRKELSLEGVHLDFSTRGFSSLPNMRMFYQDDGFMKWNSEIYQPPVVLRGYFQYLPALMDSLPKIVEELRCALEARRGRMKQKYELGENPIFLHVRRGDYLNHPDFHYIQGVDYYACAIQEIVRRTGNYPEKICVVSDDLGWCKDQEIFQKMPNRIFVEEDELNTLALMSLCEGGAICGNSTFSWWGAQLGAERKKNPVLYPKKWIAKPNVTLFYKNWISI